MNGIVPSLAEQLEYFTLTQIENGIGAFLHCVHKYSNSRNYHVIQSAINEAEVLRVKFDDISDQESVGNLLSLSQSLFGVKSSELHTLMKCLLKSGYTTIMASQFLPALLYSLRKTLPESVFNQILSDIPGLNKFGYYTVGRISVMAS